MIALKCKMCGGDLSVSPGASVGTCQYCGTTMTLPVTGSTQVADQFNRASGLRQGDEFDRASEVYLRLLEANPRDAEAHWGMVLCRFGITYVEDPKTGRRLPTCNRVRFGSILEDEDYLQAITWADGEAKAVYQAEAEAIAAIQREFLDISAREEPFDVFLCYKEKDGQGERTPDSVLAQELYYELTEKGYRVFFSRLTLEGKLGISYEPYIFAALRSARVMVVVTTRAEYVNAPWVKNEWSRYLALIRQGEDKVLIPAYRDMDPYTLPEELASLQAQDMGKLGFMQDLLEGIHKFLRREPDDGGGRTGPTASTLTKRGMLALEDGDFAAADAHFERALDHDPEEAMAYVGKLMVERKVKVPSDLGHTGKPLEASSNYRKAVRFADPELKKLLEGCNEQLLAARRALEQQLTGRPAVAQNASPQKTPTKYVRQDKPVKTGSLGVILLVLLGLMLLGVLLGSPSSSTPSSSPESSAPPAPSFTAEEMSQLYADAIQLVEQGSYDELKRILPHLTQQQRAEVDPTLITQARERYSALDFSAAFSISGLILDNAEARSLHFSMQRVFAQLLSTSGDLVAALPFTGGEFSLYDGQGNSSSFYLEGAQSISLFSDCAAAICGDGSVICQPFEAGTFSPGFQAELSQWRDTASLVSLSDCLLGRRTDGTVAYAGKRDGSDSSIREAVSSWSRVAGLYAAGDHAVVALCADGTVRMAGENPYYSAESFSQWSGLYTIAVTDTSVLGILLNGTLLSAGDDGWVRTLDTGSDLARCISYSVSEGTIAGLRPDGTVAAYGLAGGSGTADWIDIIQLRTRPGVVYGLCRDGTVRTSGTGAGEETWRDIIFLLASPSGLLGIQNDGTLHISGDFPAALQSSVSAAHIW
ncbi:toll/interleukin-1 receptor domain-containing protein [Intestinimonas butyriciproducens]|uniref:toll/interleukin-1 receptor domain-containing protein n=1 Tax=Intestinimonas butyriciproducens TaxID=1297617 RepID=UPI0018AB36CC|nr:toll/interleukin-1 receptor domain-containing protein [Intestinimonas butyriciproducens]MDB7860918.1 TIR domain-containing protein [Intestinimonas butyriciproducens]MDB7863107.1 TIR domain-containing protein [Intestinimonas butyriciproducens]